MDVVEPGDGQGGRASLVEFDDFNHLGAVHESWGGSAGYVLAFEVFHGSGCRSALRAWGCCHQLGSGPQASRDHGCPACEQIGSRGRGGRGARVGKGPESSWDGDKRSGHAGGSVDRDRQHVIVGSAVTRAIGSFSPFFEGARPTRAIGLSPQGNGLSRIQPLSASWTSGSVRLATAESAFMPWANVRGVKKYLFAASSS